MVKRGLIGDLILTGGVSYESVQSSRLDLLFLSITIRHTPAFQATPPSLREGNDIQLPF